MSRIVTVVLILIAGLLAGWLFFVAAPKDLVFFGAKKPAPVSCLQPAVPGPMAAPTDGCHTKVRLPDTITRTTEKVLVRAARIETHRIPAVTRTVRRTLMVKPAWVELVTHPAEYRQETTQVLLSPEHVEWKAGSGAPTVGANTGEAGQTRVLPTGEVWCSVVIPARYRTQTNRVLVSPTIVEHLTHPAVTRVVEETQVVAPARTETVQIAPVYRTVAHIVRTPRYGWKRIPCRKPAPAHRAIHRVYPQPIEAVPYGERG